MTNVTLRGNLIACAALLAAATAAVGAPYTAEIARVQAVDIAHGRVTSAVWHPADEKDKDGKPALFAGCVEVRFESRPSELSDIHFVAALPAPEKWNGRFHAVGTVGGGGNHPFWVSDRAKSGAVAADTDLGSSKGMRSEGVLLDYGRRATHLLATETKKIIRAFYGCPQRHSYYSGLSTGGQQGVAAAMFHPDDFDGISVYVPAMDRVRIHIYHAWCKRQTFDDKGKCLFSKAQSEAVRQAGLDWFADKDEPYARGRFVTDPRWTPEAEAGIIDLAAKRDPSLDTPDYRRRLRELFRGPEVNGRRIFPGFPFGMKMLYDWGVPWNHNFLLNWYGRDYRAMTDAQFEEWIRAWGPWLNALETDLSGFRASGGKMIIVGGMSDTIVPCWTMAEWYEDAARANGGLEALSRFCKLYLLPGRDHCGEVPGVTSIDASIYDWVEKGKEPGTVSGSVRGGKKGEKVPIAPYPLMTTGSAETGWGFKPWPKKGDWRMPMPPAAKTAPAR